MVERRPPLGASADLEVEQRADDLALPVVADRAVHRVLVGSGRASPTRRSSPPRARARGAPASGRRTRSRRPGARGTPRPCRGAPAAGRASRSSSSPPSEPPREGACSSPPGTGKASGRPERRRFTFHAWNASCATSESRSRYASRVANEAGEASKATELRCSRPPRPRGVRWSKRSYRSYGSAPPKRRASSPRMVRVSSTSRRHRRRRRRARAGQRQ